MGSGQIFACIVAKGFFWTPGRRIHHDVLGGAKPILLLIGKSPHTPYLIARKAQQLQRWVAWRRASRYTPD